MDLLQGTDAAKLVGFLGEARVAIAVAAGFAFLSVARASQQHWVRAAMLSVLAAVTLLYLPSVLAYLRGLSSDSFAELANPSFSEVLFFLSTAASVIDPLSPRRFATALTLIALLAVGAWFSVKRPGLAKARHVWLLGFALVTGVLVSAAVTTARAYSKSAAEIEMVRATFSGPPPQIQGTARRLHVVTYIGESTSTMNWHLYGYTRQTTPDLEARQRHDDGLLVFGPAFATHTHTSPSLMDALGIARRRADSDLRPIYNRSYASLIAVLNEAKVDTALISNQGQHGTWNVGGAAVFEGVGAARYALGTRALGNNEAQARHAFDDEYFAQNLPAVWRRDRPQAIFLHSYAGHGPYLANIPREFRKSIDATLTGRRSHAIVGDQLPNAALLTSEVDDYDSAMRYVDRSVDSVIAWLSDRDEPAVLVYFSDHGDSPWSGRGHDSARVLHEMLRVPLLVYFNHAARMTYPELFARYREGANRSKMILLSRIAGTILDFFELQSTPHAESLLATGVSRPERLVVRDLGEGPSSVWITPPGRDGTVAPGVDDSDVATRVFRVANSSGIEPGGPSICYHRANNLARARRATLVADCLEIDVAVPKGGQRIEVYHPPAAPVGFTLSEVLDLAVANRKGLWIDAKDLSVETQCERLQRQLAESRSKVANLLVEFAPNLDLGLPSIRACMQGLQALGIRRSYYVPTGLASACSADIRAGHGQSTPCVQFRSAVVKAIGAGMYSDIGFDYSGLEAVRTVPGADRLRWNTWGVSPDVVRDGEYSGFGFVIVDVSGDPNHY